MSKALYEIYKKDVFKLAKTLVIKSEVAAQSINNALRVIGRYVDDADPKSWRYYQNLAGDYHYIDLPMEVVSLDDLTTIAFTKENMRIHRATAKAYEYGTPYYRALVNRFPKQEDLILGILNPIDIDVAVAAKNNSILWYDKRLVESNEYNFIEKLQEFVDAFQYRNDITGYGISHELFAPALYGILAANLVPAIMGIRLENCHTPNVHSFHIWSYLADKGHLDRFKDYLTKGQALWLYRNINILTAHVGKTSTHAALVENILTKRGIPCVSYDMVQNVAAMPEELYPEAMMVASPLNFAEQQPRQRTFKTVQEIIEKQTNLARENHIYTAQAIDETNYAMERSAISSLPTKVYESHVIDRSESKFIRFIDVLLNEWIHLSSNRRYNAMLTLQDPQTGEGFTMSAKDSFILYLYLYNKAQGLDLKNVPVVQAKRVRRFQLPTKATLREVATMRHVTDRMLDDSYLLQPAIGLIVSTASFNDLCREIYDAGLFQYTLWTKQQSFHSKAQMELVCGRYWTDATCEFVSTPQSMSTWLKDRGLLFESLSEFDAGLLAKEILDKATGQDLSKQFSLAEIQRAMLEIMVQCGSYTTHYIQSINSEPLVLCGFAPIRTGEDKSSNFDKVQVEIPTSDILRDRSKELDDVKVGVLSNGVEFHEKSLDRSYTNLQLYVDIWETGRTTDKVRIQIRPPSITVVSEG